MSTLPEPLSKNDLIAEISRDTSLRPAVVALVLERLVDISVEQIVNTSGFTIRGLFSVDQYVVRDAKVPGTDERIGDQVRIRAKLSPNIKKLHKLQQREFPDKPFFVNRDNWRGALKWAASRKIPRLEPQVTAGDETYNPLLDDED